MGGWGWEGEVVLGDPNFGQAEFAYGEGGGGWVMEGPNFGET